MKILIYFPRKKLDIFFEGAMLENKIKKACKSATVFTTFNREADIANFINLRKESVKVIHQAIKYSIPTLLWLFYANIDENARVLELRKDGSQYIPQGRLETINMMDGVVVPTNEARALLRRLGVMIPVFVIYGAVNVARVSELKSSESDIFRRYFRINEGQKYTLSVMNIKAKYALDQLNMLAAAVPDYEFYAFISSKSRLIDYLRIKSLKKRTEKNLTVLPLIPEDVYRSGLLHASYFINLGTEKMDIMSLYEPMYAKVPIIVQKDVIFNEIIDETAAFVVNDFSGAAYVMLNVSEATDIIENAHNYTIKVSESMFSEAIFNLFKKIYTR